ncbi:uncharacterized protein LOC142976436 [Anticarsia gemmatalis]|uniref:uncharacterized protein LOC142976436 n=1 Tax=Anticarsia gemmatalis TaxID=129554 RepID=UPI003F757648
MKMTNKEDGDGDPSCNPRLAAFLAVHLVRQILDDAYVIANSASESGQPWRHQCMLKNAKSDDEDASSKAESDIVNENKIELIANVVATSTPQKVTGELLKCRSATSFIGQGDEDPEMRQNELAKSTSMFINHLFDMSEVETVTVRDDPEIVQNNSEANEQLTQAMTMIMDSYINTAMGIASKVPPQSVDGGTSAERSSETEYSFLSDAFAADFGTDIAFTSLPGVDDAIASSHYEASHIVPAVQIIEISDENIEECMKRNDVTRFENAYLTLNRDYEQCSEDDGNVILDDPKGMTLQEVELLTANTSDDELSAHDETELHVKCEKSKELTAISAVSAVSKKSLVSRCRSQGARLLSCLRGWWRRRTPGKRKEHQHRIQGAVHGLCPLSPDARRRAASLLDQRLLRSPSPSRAVVWKFNTVNEALVKSSRWKDYTFDAKPDDCEQN